MDDDVIGRDVGAWHTRRSPGAGECRELNGEGAAGAERRRCRAERDPCSLAQVVDVSRTAATAGQLLLLLTYASELRALDFGGCSFRLEAAMVRQLAAQLAERQAFSSLRMAACHRWGPNDLMMLLGALVYRSWWAVCVLRLPSAPSFCAGRVAASSAEPCCWSGAG
jgi:hypothetical protein